MRGRLYARLHRLSCLRVLNEETRRLGLFVPRIIHQSMWLVSLSCSKCFTWKRSTEIIVLVIKFDVCWLVIRWYFVYFSCTRSCCRPMRRSRKNWNALNYVRLTLAMMYLDKRTISSAWPNIYVALRYSLDSTLHSYDDLTGRLRLHQTGWIEALLLLVLLWKFFVANFSQTTNCCVIVIQFRADCFYLPKEVTQRK